MGKSKCSKKTFWDEFTKKWKQEEEKAKVKRIKMKSKTKPPKNLVWLRPTSDIRIRQAYYRRSLSTTNSTLKFIEFPFKNYVILSEIGKHLSLIDLKAARGVNQLWYSEFSRNLSLTIPNEKEFSEIMKLHSKKKDNFHLQIPMKNFNFGHHSLKWEYEINIFKSILQLGPISQIRRLTLPSSITSISIFKVILNFVAPNLEFLKIQQPKFVTDSSSEPSVICMKKLEHIFIVYKENSSNGKLFDQFLQNLIKGSSTSLTEITLEDACLLDLQDSLLINEIKKEKKMKSLNFLGSTTYLQREFGPGISKLINVVEKLKLKINFYEAYLNYENFRDFIRIISLYDENENWINLRENPGYFLNLKLSSVKTMYEVSCSSFLPNIKIDKIFHHFPNLKKQLKCSQRRGKWIESAGSTNEHLQELYYYQEYFKNSGSLLCQNIAEIFPNLTKLEIRLSILFKHTIKRLTLVPIFKTLTKLQELHFDNFCPNSFVPDRDLTGILKSKIKKLRGKSYNYLKNFNIEPKHRYRNYKGIANLTELRKFRVDIGFFQNEISLLFAFRHLPKLEHLEIRVFKWISLMNEDYLRIFLDDYPNLTYLTLPIRKVFNIELPIVKKIKTQKPKLEIKLTPTETPNDEDNLFYNTSDEDSDDGNSSESSLYSDTDEENNDADDDDE